MGNTQGVLTEEQMKELLGTTLTVFDFHKSFYDAYKDASNLQKMREQYEEYQANLSKQEELYPQKYSGFDKDKNKLKEA